MTLLLFACDLIYLTIINILIYKPITMTIRIHMDYMSQPSRAVWALCLIAKIPHEIKEVKIAKLEMKSEEYLKINPMGKVPAIEDTQNNFKLA